MATFKVGDRVLVVQGPRKGALAVIVAALKPCAPRSFRNWWSRYFDAPPMLHELDVPSFLLPGCNSHAPPEWLRHYYDGNEKGVWTEELRNLCREKESA